jgi:transcriptional regulator with XRE-family HTH domain
MSQKELARHLKLTFQQVQKYEGGVNRINASYLFALAQLLNVSVSYFFDETESAGRAGDLPDDVKRFLMSAEGLSLWRAFARVEDGAVRQRIVALVRAVAAAEHQAPA